jgi:hypothetical protein
VVWRVQKISHVCLGVVSFLEGEHPRKIHMVGVVLSSMVFSTASIAPNSRCFEGLLLVFDSDYSGLCTLAADDHTSLQATLFSRGIYKTTIGDVVLDGLLPSCFVVWCALIVCGTLGIWWISSENCSPMSHEVLFLRVPEIAFQNEGVLPVVAQGP